ncbi:MAG: hypothetical protein HQK63_16650 [Desulfamplus sp.]|nr:hypothetical protein [Desulfamplus sp.]
MKKLLLGILLLALALVPVSTMAGVHIGLNFSLPPLIEFYEPPELIVIPETYIYVVPDVEEEIFFYGGWWWRPWEGHWYRSQSYDTGWEYYQRVPSFYIELPSDWRNDYRHNRWRGQEWHHQRTHHRDVQRNWKEWERSRYWENQNNWGGHDLKPRRNEHERNYNRRSYEEVQQRGYQPQLNERNYNNHNDRAAPEQDYNNRHKIFNHEQERSVQNFNPNTREHERNHNNRNERLLPTQEYNKRRPYQDVQQREYQPQLNEQYANKRNVRDNHEQRRNNHRQFQAVEQREFQPHSNYSRQNRSQNDTGRAIQNFERRKSQP